MTSENLFKRLLQDFVDLSKGMDWLEYGEFLLSINPELGNLLEESSEQRIEETMRKLYESTSKDF